ncbi:MAG: hypothetical protein K1X29_09950 [Bdellovibrionales bacterium]|nr:hypothetical protein [Bdellovibrionales bacterium]
MRICVLILLSLIHNARADVQASAEKYENQVVALKELMIYVSQNHQVYLEAIAKEKNSLLEPHSYSKMDDSSCTSLQTDQKPEQNPAFSSLAHTFISLDLAAMVSMAQTICTLDFVKTSGGSVVVSSVERNNLPTLIFVDARRLRLTSEINSEKLEMDSKLICRVLDKFAQTLLLMTSEQGSEQGL